MMSADIDLSQYLDAFLEETKEHLQTLMQALIDIEGADAERAADVLNGAFRAAHTVKGMSASMDFRNVEHLCHAMEDVMDELRSGSRSVTPEIIDLLLKCATTLEELTCGIEETGSDDVDVSGVLSELENLKEEEKRGTKNKEDNGKRKRYEITVSLDKNCEFKGARSFLALKNLAETGEIIKTVPPREDLEDEKFDVEFNVVLAT